jgi:glycosyltransferase involved in cell wall biosynthesis
MPDTSIAFVGNYLPRRCGIATFTHDLCEAVALQTAGRDDDVFVLAMNDQPEGYPYPNRVRFEVRQNAQADYRLAAEFLNVHQVDVVCLQHEYGIFGGTCGSHILGLLRRLHRPLVATLHTVLKEPNEEQKLTMRELGRLADKLVVMSDVAHDMLKEVYDVPNEKVVTIPHGIPDVPFVDPSYFKDQFGVEGRKVMLTFGLLSPGKGLEYAIESLPAIVDKCPELVYIILGATHPHTKRDSGEEYRNSLVMRVNELGLGENVKFVNRFVDLKELCEYLGAADLYVTPYLNAAQITSGTLAYAMGTGKAVISTPYWYAEEMLAEQRGLLVPFRDSEAIAEKVLSLLENEVELNATRKRAYNYCRKMIWSRVAQDYLDIFQQAKDAWVERRHHVVRTPAALSETTDELPEADLRHLRTMTDDTGLLQHCKYSTPDRRYGYRTEDNARALIATTMYWDQEHEESVLGLIQTYLSFLDFAFHEKSGRFRNKLLYERRFDADEAFSETCHGRVIWALGTAVALCPHESMIALATRLFHEGLSVMEDFKFPRSWALAIVGIQAYLRRFGGDSEVRRFRAMFAERLMEGFEKTADEDWPWCEDTVTYASAKIPHALMMAGKWMQRNEMIERAKSSLQWLLEIQTQKDGMFSFVGTEGFYPRGGKMARWDQQPIEAQSIVEACVEAYRVTREDHWLQQARRAFNWFLGDNDLRTPLYDFTTGGCRDGLHADRVNENQGAESLLAWLISLLTMHDIEMERTLGHVPADSSTGLRPVASPIKPTGPVVGARTKKHGVSDRND